MFMFALLIFPMVSADIIIDQVDESSGVVFDKPLDIELQNAIVNISVNQYGEGTLKATFEIMSKEAEETNARLYLKAKGKSCYHGCEDVDITEWTTRFRLHYLNEIPLTETDFGDGSSTRGYLIEQDETLVVENNEGKFAGTKEFNLVPGETLIVEIEQDISLPFEYYLDSLSTFSKADYEKITIKGDDLNVQFNEKYPVKKISENEWVWEYSDINTDDGKLKDVLTISKGDSPEPEPKKSFFKKIIDWFKNIF